MYGMLGQPLVCEARIFYTHKRTRKINEEMSKDVMSATSFGGSLDTVRTHDDRLMGLFLDHMKETVIMGYFPFLKWPPFVKLPATTELNKLADGIISKRRDPKEPPRNDLLQILFDAHKAMPDAFSEEHIKEEMFLFM